MDWQFIKHRNPAVPCYSPSRQVKALISPRARKDDRRLESLPQVNKNLIDRVSGEHQRQILLDSTLTDIHCIATSKRKSEATQEEACEIKSVPRMVKERRGGVAPASSNQFLFQWQESSSSYLAEDLPPTFGDRRPRPPSRIPVAPSLTSMDPGTTSIRRPRKQTRKPPLPSRKQIHDPVQDTILSAEKPPTPLHELYISREYQKFLTAHGTSNSDMA